MVHNFVSDYRKTSRQSITEYIFVFNTSRNMSNGYRMQKMENGRLRYKTMDSREFAT